MNPQQYAYEQGLSVVSAEIVPDMPEHEYHQTSGLGEGQYITRSMVKAYAEDPRGFRLQYVDREPLMAYPESESMRLGTYFDVLITEGLPGFVNRYRSPDPLPTPDGWLTPGGNISTKADVKQAIADACARGIVYEGVPATYKAWTKGLPEGVELMDNNRAKLALFMRDRLKENPLAMHQLEGAQFQLTIRATLQNGRKLQIRPDYWNESLHCLGDVKTTSKPLRSFLSDAVTYGYDIQDALYTWIATAAGLDVQLFQFIVQQSKRPFGNLVVGMPDEVREWSLWRALRALAGICSEDYGEPQTTTSIPHVDYWLKNVIDEDLSR